MAFHRRTTLRALAGASLVALGAALAPAVQARNHAQTGVSPKKILGVER